VLREAGKDPSRLDGYTWHSNRHTFASRLAMAGADLLTVKELRGWRTLATVQRYAHLAPGHLAAAVERLVPGVAAEKDGKQAREDAGAAASGEPEPSLGLQRSFDGTGTPAVGVS
jgi:hypothetical protein